MTSPLTPQRRSTVSLIKILLRSQRVWGALVLAACLSLVGIRTLQTVPGVARNLAVHPRELNALTGVALSLLGITVIAGVLWVRAVSAALLRVALADEQSRLLTRLAQESQLRYRSLFDHSLDAVFVVEVDGRISHVNPMCEVLTGYSGQELVGEHYLKVILPERSSRAEAEFTRLVRGETRVSVLLLLHKSGRQLRCTLSAVPVMVEGQSKGLYCIVRDVTAETQAQHLLAEQKRILEQVALHRPLSRTLAELSKSVERILSGAICVVSLADASGRELQLAVGSESAATAVQKLHGSSATRPILASDGVLLGTLSISYAHQIADIERDGPVLDAFSQLAALAIEQQRSHEQIRHLAFHDPLTKLPNRDLFFEALSTALKESGVPSRPTRKTGVLFLDLDRFKSLNDSLGHAVGDALLIAVAERVASCLGANDVVSRLGGDEFTVLLPDVGSTTEAMQIAQNIQTVLGRPIEAEGVRLQLRSSIGVAVSPDHGVDGKTLMRHADIAMYQSKRTRDGATTLYLPGMLGPMEWDAASRHQRGSEALPR